MKKEFKQPKYLLINKHTKETIDLEFDGTNIEEVYKKAQDKANVKEIYYTRQTMLEAGVLWVDFGSYTWFIYIVPHGIEYSI